MNNRPPYNIPKPPFKNEEETIEWVRWHIPFCTRAKSPLAKTTHVAAFASQHAYDDICVTLGKKLYKQLLEAELNQ